MIERLWTIAQPKEKGPGIVYAIGATRKDAWEMACFVLYQCYHPPMIDRMKAEGFRAIRADVIYTTANVKLLERKIK